MMNPAWPLVLSALALVGCQAPTDAELARLASEPLSSEPWLVSNQPWTFGHGIDGQGRQISTQHFVLYTTVTDTLYLHQLGRVLEATYRRHEDLYPSQPAVLPRQLNCYVFASRIQWETHTREQAGSNAPVYLQISSGGYCQQGVFAGYDVGRDRTLSVIAHEAWHQYSWFAFKDRLPSWLEEGLATQNEAIVWQGGEPAFFPENNTRRMAALRDALHNDRLWNLYDLVSTHAGRVIQKPRGDVDAYYAQLWALTLFLQHSPHYAPRLKQLLADAAAGTLTKSLAGTSVTRREIDDFSEHWNAVAGPVYLEKYINPDLAQLEREYRAWLRQFAG